MNQDPKEGGSFHEFSHQSVATEQGFAPNQFFVPFNPYMMMNRGAFFGNFHNQGNIPQINLPTMYPTQAPNNTMPRQFNPFANIGQFRINPFPQITPVFPFTHHTTQSSFYQPGPPNMINQVQRPPYFQDQAFWPYNDARNVPLQHDINLNYKEIVEKNQNNFDFNALHNLKGIKICQDEAESEKGADDSDTDSSCSQDESENQQSQRRDGNMKIGKKIRKNGKKDKQKVKKKSQYLIRKEKLKAEIAMNGEMLDMEEINDEGEEIEIQDSELKEIEEEIKEVIDLVKRRPKQRRIRDVLTLIRLRNSIKAKKKLKYFQDAEQIMMRFGVSMKSFRDYNTELRIAEKFGFDIEQNLDQGFGIIREYNDLLLQENQYPKKQQIRREIRKKNTLFFNQQINAIQINEPEQQEEKRQKSLSTSSNSSESGSATALLYNNNPSNSHIQTHLPLSSDTLQVPVSHFQNSGFVYQNDNELQEINIQIENAE